MIKNGSYYLDIENKVSLRFTFRSENKEIGGIISANKLKKFSLNNSGNRLPKGKVTLAWDNHQPAEVFCLDTLIRNITHTAINDVKPLIQAIYRIHNRKHNEVSIQKFYFSTLFPDDILMESEVSIKIDNFNNLYETYYGRVKCHFINAETGNKEKWDEINTEWSKLSSATFTEAVEEMKQRIEQIKVQELEKRFCWLE
ncbi:hypothetical protein [Mesobacillus jeotgali]|uniref:DUF2441 domain-containing protein n=1 Tax=Mesobacillus jeotgali TaxID=129985 RepID=A0ABY9VCI7_9BACI|nr:hypothetical protein [Mesobacillus jeotgali]WNF21333.1 hypothetical protein RH061_14125 [Mesobacillus jeotgali]